MQNPLEVQELVDQCIDFLRDSPSDLKACACVSRSWVAAAQAHIFKEVSLLLWSPTGSKSGPQSAEKSWARLRQVLTRSPHLIRHIHRLQLDSTAVSIEAFAAICEFPFTHLCYIFLRHLSESFSLSIATQKLVSHPTLRHMKIVADLSEASSWIWDRCSPNLRHLELSCLWRSFQPNNTVPSHPRSTPIVLESLKTDSLEFIDAWLMQEMCPFDMSHLKIVSAEYGIDELLHHRKFFPALQKIKVLDFNPAADSPVDLSTLTSLVLLRITVVEQYDWQMALDTLSTIVHPNRIRKIVISSTEYLPAECGLQLDSKLDSLPLHSLLTLELERNIFEGGLTISNASQYFPQMTSRQLLRITDREENWFENFAGV
ncbi:hypothetical protein B0H17DRAFT_431512 [Mycena rosella]|uniref:F-box domain-containing protein n=1 Tax=Mycena rosella TaxID=1033263 RepID=A0AAD7DML9_MYCRO|nr:hypothetical protein B0H17DRAFT_431512 [Mycena rosella]